MLVATVLPTSDNGGHRDVTPSPPGREKARRKHLIFSSGERNVTAHNYPVRSAIRQWSSFLPDRSYAVSQRGCLPRPDQVSAGFFGFRYLGKTFGYGRRWRRSDGRSELVQPLLKSGLFARQFASQFRGNLLMELPQFIDGHRFQIAVFHWTHRGPPPPWR